MRHEIAGCLALIIRAILLLAGMVAGGYIMAILMSLFGILK